MFKKFNVTESLGFFSKKIRVDQTIKIIAIISMLFDHIGYVFFPKIYIFRVVGRLAMPIFAYGIAQGYAYTSDFGKYITRLFVFALISQLPFSLMVGNPFELNIIFGFIFSLLFLYSLDKKKYYYSIAILLLPFLIDVDYGVYQILMTFVFYKFKNNIQLLLILESFLVLGHFMQSGWWVHLLAIWGVVLVIYFPKNKFKLYITRYLFYWFYPLHLLILYILKLIL